MNFTLRTTIMHFYPILNSKDTGTMLRRNFKKIRIMYVKNSIKKPDSPIIFMKIIKEGTRTMSAVNDERGQISTSKVIWDGTIDSSEVLETILKVIMNKLVLTIYLIQVSRSLIQRGVLTVMLIFRMKYLLLPRSRRMHVHYMAHYLVHAKVV
jgi:hypothetical protein